MKSYLDKELPAPVWKLIEEYLLENGRKKEGRSTPDVISCVFCDQPVSLVARDNHVDTFECQNCGKYSITWDARDDLPGEFNRRRTNLPPRHIVSGWIRDNQERGFTTPTITFDNLPSMIDLARIPQNIIAQIEHLLLFLARRTPYLGQAVNVSLNQYAIAYANNKDELLSLFGGLRELGWITRLAANDEVAEITVAIRGLEHAYQLSGKRVETLQAFVAMWFEPKLEKVYADFIRPTVKRAGFDSLVIREKEHNNDINAEIVAEIRKSRFLIAEFTGQRGGVYFEAGFALGIGIPVIWTCREDWFNKEPLIQQVVRVNDKKVEALVPETRRTHFDVEHFAFIIWKSPEELAEKLYQRIRATIV